MICIHGHYRTDRERESSRDAQGDADPQTPWIWNPPSLTQTEGDRATPTRDFNNRRSSQDSSRSNSTPTREYGPSPRRDSQDSYNGATTTGTPVRDYFYRNTSGSRQGSVDSISSRPQGMNQQPMATPPSSSSHSRTGSIYSGRWLSQAPPFPAPPSTSTSTANASTSTTHAQQPLHAPVFTREPESFMVRGDPQPTFPSNIVRTPTHYHGTRRNTDETPIRYSRSPSAPQTSAPGSSRGPAVSEPLSRHHSLPTTSSIASLSTFTEDVISVLSPLIDTRSVATLSRSRTEPVIGQAHLSTIPETVSSSSTHSSAEAFFHPLPVPPDSDSDEDSSEPSPSPSRERQRNRERERERQRERSRNRERSQDYERARRMTPQYNANSRPSNPLPPPPMERPNPAASAPPHQSPEPAHYARRIRKGFWNRRGDHLTSNLYVVYAPQGKAYPQELREYPDETQGYKDQYGAFVPYLPERPELPTSLPYHGRPPAQPYDSVCCVFLSLGNLADGTLVCRLQLYLSGTLGGRVSYS
jgi:hypothetical protein